MVFEEDRFNKALQHLESDEGYQEYLRAFEQAEKEFSESDKEKEVTAKYRKAIADWKAEHGKPSNKYLDYEGDLGMEQDLRRDPEIAAFMDRFNRRVEELLGFDKDNVNLKRRILAFRGRGPGETK